MKLGIFA